MEFVPDDDSVIDGPAAPMSITVAAPTVEEGGTPPDSVEVRFKVRASLDNERESFPDEQVSVYVEPSSDGSYDLAGGSQSSVVTITEGVCDRSRAVCVAIVQQIDDQQDPDRYCRHVTESQMDGIRELEIDDQDLTHRDFNNDDLSNLEYLQSLDMSGNNFSRLPPGFFSGLGNLHTATFADNTAGRINLPVAIEPLPNANGQNDRFQLVMATGTPFETSVTLNATNDNATVYLIPDSIALDDFDSSTSPKTIYTIPAGGVYSEAIKVVTQDAGVAASPASAVSITAADFVDPAADSNTEAFSVRHAGLAPSFVSTDTTNIDAGVVEPDPPKALLAVSRSGPVTEGGRDVRLTISVTRPVLASEAPLTGTVGILDSEATGEHRATQDADYSFDPNFSIAEGERYTVINVSILQDTLIEPPQESFVVGINEGEGYVTDPGNVGRVVINDGVCDRSPKVEEALKGLLDITACNDESVTLSSLKALSNDLRIDDAETLKSKDLLFLDSITVLDFRGSEGLKQLPAGFFKGVELVDLYLPDNDYSYQVGVWFRYAGHDDAGKCVMDYGSDIGIPAHHRVYFLYETVGEDPSSGWKPADPGKLRVPGFLSLAGIKDGETIDPVSWTGIYYVGTNAPFGVPSGDMSIITHAGPRKCRDADGNVLPVDPEPVVPPSFGEYIRVSGGGLNIHPESYIRPRGSDGTVVLPQATGGNSIGDESEWKAVSIKGVSTDASETDTGSQTRSGSGSSSSSGEQGATEMTYDSLVISMPESVDWNVIVPFSVTAPGFEGGPVSGPVMLGWGVAVLPAGQKSLSLDKVVGVARSGATVPADSMTFMLADQVHDQERGYTVSDGCGEATVGGSEVSEFCNGDDSDDLENNGSGAASSGGSGDTNTNDGGSGSSSGSGGSSIS